MAAYACVLLVAVLAGCNNGFNVLTESDLLYLPVSKCAVFEPTVSCAVPLPDAQVCGHQPLVFSDADASETYHRVSLDKENWIQVVSGVTTFSDIPGFVDVTCGAEFTFYLAGENLCNSIDVSVVKLGLTLEITAPATGAQVCGHDTISFTDADTFETNHQVSVDNTNWVSATSGITRFRDIPEFAGLGCADGLTFTLYVRGQDGCNLAQVNLEKKNITLAITAPASGTNVCGHDRITFTDSDTLETAWQASVNGTSWVAFVSNNTRLYQVPGFSTAACDSDFTLLLRGTDGCNQTSISLHKKGVTISVTSPATGASVCGGNTITFTESDAQETTHQASIDGINWYAFTSGSTFSAITNFGSVPGPLTLSVRGSAAIDGCNVAQVDNLTKIPTTITISSPMPDATVEGTDTIASRIRFQPRMISRSIIQLVV